MAQAQDITVAMRVVIDPVQGRALARLIDTDTLVAEVRSRGGHVITTPPATATPTGEPVEPINGMYGDR